MNKRPQYEMLHLLGSAKIPAVYICPLSWRLMRDPVADPDDEEGRAVDREAFEEHQRRYGVRPLTGLAPIVPALLLPRTGIQWCIEHLIAHEEDKLAPAKRARGDGVDVQAALAVLAGPATAAAVSAAASAAGRPLLSLNPDSEIPGPFFCPLSRCLMWDPVVDRRDPTTSFERAALQEHVKMYGTNPRTGQPMCPADLLSDKCMRSGIRSWLARHAGPGLDLYCAAPPQPATSGALMEVGVGGVTGEHANSTADSLMRGAAITSLAAQQVPAAMAAATTTAVATAARPGDGMTFKTEPCDVNDYGGSKEADPATQIQQPQQPQGKVKVAVEAGAPVGPGPNEAPSGPSAAGGVAAAAYHFRLSQRDAEVIYLNLSSDSADGSTLHNKGADLADPDGCTNGGCGIRGISAQRNLHAPPFATTEASVPAAAVGDAAAVDEGARGSAGGMAYAGHRCRASSAGGGYGRQRSEEARPRSTTVASHPFAARTMPHTVTGAHGAATAAAAATAQATSATTSMLAAAAEMASKLWAAAALPGPSHGDGGGAAAASPERYPAATAGEVGGDSGAAAAAAAAAGVLPEPDQDQTEGATAAAGAADEADEEEEEWICTDGARRRAIVGYSAAELEAMVAGVEQHGATDWAAIKASQPVLATRTTSGLSQKWRVLLLQAAGGRARGRGEELSYGLRARISAIGKWRDSRRRTITAAAAGLLAQQHQVALGKGAPIVVPHEAMVELLQVAPTGGAACAGGGSAGGAGAGGSSGREARDGMGGGARAVSAAQVLAVFEASGERKVTVQVVDGSRPTRNEFYCAILRHIASRQQYQLTHCPLLRRELEGREVTGWGTSPDTDLVILARPVTAAAASGGSCGAAAAGDGNGRGCAGLGRPDAAATAGGLQSGVHDSSDGDNNDDDNGC